MRRHVLICIDADALAGQVARAVPETAVGLEAVAAGPSALLRVGLDRLGNGVVQHESNVGLVDAQSEG